MALQTPRQAAGVNVRTIRGLRLAVHPGLLFLLMPQRWAGSQKQEQIWGGLKHQSAQYPSKHRAMNRGAKKLHPTPPARRCEKRPAASRNVALAGQPAGLPDRLRLAPRPGSFALSPLMDEP